MHSPPPLPISFHIGNVVLSTLASIHSDTVGGGMHLVDLRVANKHKEEYTMWHLLMLSLQCRKVHQSQVPKPIQWSWPLRYAYYYWYFGDNVKNSPLNCLPSLSVTAVQFRGWDWRMLCADADMHNNHGRHHNIIGWRHIPPTLEKKSFGPPPPHIFHQKY